MVIFLVGFMGSGKSSFLQRLSRSDSSLIWQFVDLDEKIYRDFARKTDAHLGELIDRVGMAKFRELETRALREVLESGRERHMIVALGGGCLGDSEHHPNRDKITRGSSGEVFTVWLATSFEECWKRIEKSSERPLASLGKEELRRLYQKREPLYRRCDLALDVEQVDQIETPEDLLVLLQRGKN